MVEGTWANLTVWDPQKDLIVRVCVSNAVGCGPWSQPLVVSSHDHAGEASRGRGQDEGFQGCPRLVGGGWQHLTSQQAQGLGAQQWRLELVLTLNLRLYLRSQ